MRRRGISRATTLLNLSYHKVFLIIPFSFILSSVLIPIITNKKTGMKNHAQNHNIFVYQKIASPYEKVYI